MTRWNFSGYDSDDLAAEFIDAATGEAYYHHYYGRNVMAEPERAVQPGEPKLLETMAREYGLAPKAFENTLRATVFPKGSNEQLAAFLLVARKYKLNPFTKEIYAIPREEGIATIVPIDGWLRIINDHPQFDGMQLEELFSPDGEFYATTCRIYRKDRSHPMEMTEYLVECRQKTPSWAKWPVRMLRHKATIQAARYAFSLSGIIDPDEAERFIPETRQPEHQEPPLSRFKTVANRYKETEKQDQAKIAAEATLREQLKASVEHEEKAAKDAEVLAALPASPEIDIPAAYEMGVAAWHRAVNRDQWPASFKNQPKLVDAWQSGWDREEHAGGDAA